MSEITILTITKVIGYIIFLQMLFMHACAIDVTLTNPSTTIKAQIGEVYHITCQAFKCQNPGFTWSSLMDQTLSGTVNTTGQMSILTMKIRSESDGSYRCTVSCDNPPAERVFKVITYSFPTEPVLNISSLTVGEQSRITCTIPNIYPSEMFSAKIYLGEEEVYKYMETGMDTEAQKVKNISMSYDFIVTDKYESKEVKCLAEMAFLDDSIEPMEKFAMRRLNLLYPPEEINITVNPFSNVRAYEKVSLYCSYKSIFPAKIQWVKLDNDKERVLPSDEHGTLTILHAISEDSGVYICYVQNEVGKTSSQVNITVEAVLEKPMLSIYPKSTAKIGQSVTIECVASGNANVNVTLWKVLKDVDMPLLEKAGSYIIKETNPIDAAMYKCKAKNQYGVSEASQSLTVEYPPVETLLSLSEDEVNEGDTVTLSCTSKGEPEPSFFLYHLLPSGKSTLLSEGPVVTLTNATTGIYQCEARNRLGSKKDKLELKVRFKPRYTFLTISPSLTVREGDRVSIRCTSEAYPIPILVLKKMTETGPIYLEAENGQYNIKHAVEEHLGKYICESTNVVGQEVAEATLTVQALSTVPPKDTHITIIPSSMPREGEFVQILCTSEGTPAPTIALKVRTEEGERELTEGGQYQIAHVKLKHSGTYICESTNLAGQQIEEATLTIKAPPKNTRIRINPPSLPTEGDDVQIQCISEGFPTPRLVLKKKTVFGQIDLLESENGLYNITNVGLRDIGIYICESTNGAGQQTAETKLNVERGYYLVPSRNTTIVTPSQNITATVTTINTHVIPSAERQQSPRFDYVPTVIIGSVVFVSACAIGIIIHHLKQARVQGSYSLVKALRSKV